DHQHIDRLAIGNGSRLGQLDLAVFVHCLDCFHRCSCCFTGFTIISKVMASGAYGVFLKAISITSMTFIAITFPSRPKTNWTRGCPKSSLSMVKVSSRKCLSLLLNVLHFQTNAPFSTETEAFP